MRKYIFNKRFFFIILSSVILLVLLSFIAFNYIKQSNTSNANLESLTRAVTFKLNENDEISILSDNLLSKNPTTLSISNGTLSLKGYDESNNLIFDEIITDQRQFKIESFEEGKEPVGSVYMNYDVVMDIFIPAKVEKLELINLTKEGNKKIANLSDIGPTAFYNPSELNKIDVVVYGDRYTNPQDFDRHYQELIDSLDLIAPFKDQPYKNAFKFRKMSLYPDKMLSKEYINIYDALGYIPTSEFYDLLSQTTVAGQREAVVLLINKEAAASTSGNVISLTVDPARRSTKNVFLHELGHVSSLWSLDDEYVIQEVCDRESSAANSIAMLQNNTSRIPWYDQIEDKSQIPTPVSKVLGDPEKEQEYIGAFMGSSYCNKFAYRPTYKSIMKDLSVLNFGPVSRKKILEVLNKFDLTADGSSSSTFSSSLVSSSLSRLSSSSASLNSSISSPSSSRVSSVSTSRSSTSTSMQCSRYDLDKDMKVDIRDFVAFKTDYGKTNACNLNADFIQDCIVNIYDFVKFRSAAIQYINLNASNDKSKCSQIK